MTKQACPCKIHCISSLFPATLTGLRLIIISHLPNVAAARQRWAGGHNRFAVFFFKGSTPIDNQSFPRNFPIQNFCAFFRGQRALDVGFPFWIAQKSDATAAAGPANFRSFRAVR